jgi:hypothetical protein
VHQNCGFVGAHDNDLDVLAMKRCSGTALPQFISTNVRALQLSLSPSDDVKCSGIFFLRSSKRVQKKKPAQQGMACVS